MGLWSWSIFLGQVSWGEYNSMVFLQLMTTFKSYSITRIMEIEMKEAKQIVQNKKQVC